MAEHRPIVFGLVGDSAAGKTTLTGGLTRLLGLERVTHVCTDDYHRYDRKERAECGITALHPDCNYMDILELHLERLHYGQPILKPVYDHSNGTLVRPSYVQPREFVIVEGLLGYYTQNMRQFYDVKVFLCPPEDLRRVWKIKRDTQKRGYTRDEVLDEMVKREPDSEHFIRPQRPYADIVIQFYPPEGVTAEAAGGNLNVRLILRPTIPHPDLSYLNDSAHDPASGIRLGLGRDCGLPVDILEIDGNVGSEQAAKLRRAIWAHLPELEHIGSDQFGQYVDNVGQYQHSDPLALTQLLLTFHLFRDRDRTALRGYAPPVAALSRVAPIGAPALTGDER